MFAWVSLAEFPLWGPEEAGGSPRSRSFHCCAGDNWYWRWVTGSLLNCSSSPHGHFFVSEETVSYLSLNSDSWTGARVCGGVFLESFRWVIYSFHQFFFFFSLLRECHLVANRIAISVSVVAWGAVPRVRFAIESRRMFISEFQYYWCFRREIEYCVINSVIISFVFVACKSVLS